MGGSELARPEENCSGSFGGPVWARPLDLESLSGVVSPFRVQEVSPVSGSGMAGLGSPLAAPAWPGDGGALSGPRRETVKAETSGPNWAQVIGEAEAAMRLMTAEACARCRAA
jgi:hypothetical protein